MFRYIVPILILLISPALLADGSICGPHPRAWDKDHALIKEADLTPEELKKAQVHVEAAKHPTPDSPGELYMLAAAGERIIKGYKLKKEYGHQPSAAAKRKFCAWMANHAYWPE